MLKIIVVLNVLMENFYWLYWAVWSWYQLRKYLLFIMDILIARVTPLMVLLVTAKCNSIFLIIFLINFYWKFSLVLSTLLSSREPTEKISPLLSTWIFWLPEYDPWWSFWWLLDFFFSDRLNSNFAMTYILVSAWKCSIWQRVACFTKHSYMLMSIHL